MITVQLKDFLTWIHKQPGDRMVNMREFSTTNPKMQCGCLMVQYGKEHGIEFKSCTTYGWLKERNIVSAILRDNKKEAFSVFDLFKDKFHTDDISGDYMAFSRLISFMQAKYKPKK